MINKPLFSGVDYNLIFRFSVILQAVSSFCEINTIEFGKYCEETAKLYVELYPWYYMPPTVHKLLIHGPFIVSKTSLPIGKLTEEALEAQHKIIRRFRQYNTRKMSRLKTV